MRSSSCELEPSLSERAWHAAHPRFVVLAVGSVAQKQEALLQTGGTGGGELVPLLSWLFYNSIHLRTVETGVVHPPLLDKGPTHKLTSALVN